MERQVMRLTEEQLHQIVSESVQNILMQEGWWDALKGGFGKVGRDAAGAVQQGAQAVGRGVQGAYNAAKNTAQQAGQAVKNYAQDVKRAGMQASDQADVQKAIQTIQKLQKQGLVAQNAANMIIGNMRKLLSTKQY